MQQRTFANQSELTAVEEVSGLSWQRSILLGPAWEGTVEAWLICPLGRGACSHWPHASKVYDGEHSCSANIRKALCIHMSHICIIKME
jgi:hypothetical protein